MAFVIYWYRISTRNPQQLGDEDIELTREEQKRQNSPSSTWRRGLRTHTEEKKISSLVDHNNFGDEESRTHTGRAQRKILPCRPQRLGVEKLGPTRKEKKSLFSPQQLGRQEFEFLGDSKEKIAVLPVSTTTG